MNAASLGRRAGHLPPAAAFLALVLALLSFPDRALAHGEVVLADPAPSSEVIAPKRVLLRFSEPVTVSLSALRVLDIEGRSVAEAPTFAADGLAAEAPLSPVAPGLYTVVWKAFTPSDGHTTKGAYSFRVVTPPEPGATPEPARAAPVHDPPTLAAVAPDEPPAPSIVAAKWAWLTAFVVAAGLALARATFLAGTALPAGFARAHGLTAAAAVLAGGPLILARAAASGDGLGAALAILETRYGTLLLFASALVLASAAAGPRLPALAATLAAASLGALALAGHAAAVPTGAWLTVATDWVHLLFASVWLGGLVALTLVGLGYTARERGAALFRRAVWAAIGVVAATGLLSATAQVLEPRGVGGTYVGALFAKQLLVVGLVGLHVGARAVPRAREVAMVLGAALLLAVAVLGESAPPTQRYAAAIARERHVAELALATPAPTATPTPPPPSPSPRVVDLGTRTSGNFRLAATLSPARVGRNQVTLLVRDREGAVVTDALVSAFFRSAVLDVESSALPFRHVGDGRYEATDVDLAAVGEWEIRFVVTHPRLEFAIEPFLTLVDAPSSGVAPTAAPPSPAQHRPIANGFRVRVPRLGIDLPIAEGDLERDGEATPNDLALHYPGSTHPGETGNTYLYAHARRGMFLSLWDARLGDEVLVVRPDGALLRYVVEEVHPRIAVNDPAFLWNTADERLTLQTSTGPTSADPRFIVVAMRRP